MKQGVNWSNLKILFWMSVKILDKKFARNQILIQHDFSSSNMIFSSFAILPSVKPIQHFIQHDIFVMLDEILDRFNKALIQKLFDEFIFNCRTFYNLVV